MPVETKFPGNEWECVFQFPHTISWTHLLSFKDCKYTAVKSLSQGNANNQVLISWTVTSVNAYEELWDKVSLYPAAWW